MKRARREGRRPRTVLLRDLDPQRDVRGGAGKRIFGEQEPVSERPEGSGDTAPTPARGLPTATVDGADE